MDHQRSTGYIDGVTWELLNDEDKRKIAVVEVTNKTVIIDNEPVQSGVYDARMGPTMDYACGTCFVDKNNWKKCPGHFGYIKLNYPLKVPLVIDAILEWLNMVCPHCSVTYVNPSLLEDVKKSKRLKALKKETDKVKRCYNCGVERAEKIVKNKLDSLKFMKTPEDEISNIEILKIFRKITDKLISFLGIPLSYHPKNFITEIILVTPPNTRIEINSMSNSVSSSSDITKIYQMIVETNNKILADPRDDELKNNLEFYYYHLCNGDPDSTQYKKIETPHKKSFKSLNALMKGKYGIIKRSTQGKKLEKVGRSVIVGETDILPGELIISQETAMQLYQKIKVTSFNINEAIGYLENNEYPHVHAVERGGRMYEASKFKESNKLILGDYIYRHLIDGDYVLFNRMPSLTWSCISSHSIKVIKNEWAYRFNESSCIHYNADFDGDEMNFYLVNDTMSKIQCKYLNNLNNWSFSYANGVCMIGLKEDAILGMGLLTRSNVFLDLNIAYSLFSQTTVKPDFGSFVRHSEYKNPPPKDKFSGRDLVSILLQTCGCFINYKGRSKAFSKKLQAYFDYKDEDEFVEIKNGHMISGIFDKNSSQQKAFGTPFHIIANEYGIKKANEVAFNMQQLAMSYLAKRGFTIGIGDSILKKEALEQLQSIIKNKMEKSSELHHKYINNKLIAPINQTVDEYYEMQQIGILGIGQDFQDDMIKGLETDSAFYTMTSMGSKGNLIWMTNCVALYGQIKIDNKRLKQECNGRAFPYSTKNSYDPRDRGFISSYLAIGLDNKDTIGDAQAERIGLIKKSQETATTGYFSKLLTKSSENEIVNYAYGISCNEEIVQLLFGGDGLDPRKQEINRVNLLLDDEEMKKFETTWADIDKIYHNDTVKKILEDEFKSIMRSRDRLRQIYMDMELNEEDKSFDNKIKLPVDIDRLIFNNQDDNKERFDPILIIKDKEDFLKIVKRVMTNKSCTSDLPDYILTSFEKLECVVNLNLNLKVVMQKKISNKAFKFILKDIVVAYYRALVHPGTPCGIIQAQAMGEPATQAMLNSIHGNNKGGIDAVKNITHVKKSNSKDDAEGGIINPYMRFELVDTDKTDDFVKSIEMKKLRYFIKNLMILERPLTEKDKDYDMVTDFIKNSPIANISNICARLELNKIELIIKGLSMTDIALNVYEYFKDFKIGNETIEIFLVYSSMDKDDIVMFMYLVKVPKVSLMNVLVKTLTTSIRKCIVSGIRGINKATISEHNRLIKKENGGLDIKSIKYINTEGLNILKIYNDPLVKKDTFSCNSVLDMSEYFGIIAAENCIIFELKTHVGSDALDVRYCINLAKSMTYTGTPLPNTYHGIKNRYKNNVGLQIGTESLLKSLSSAVKKAKHHKVTGLTESSLFNTNIKYGTNYSKIIINHDFVKENTKTSDDILDDILAM